MSRAAHNGHFQTCKFLLEQGAEVDAMDLGDNTRCTGRHARPRGDRQPAAAARRGQASQNKQERMPIDLCHDLEQRVEVHEGGAVAVSGRVSGKCSGLPSLSPSPSLSGVEAYSPVSNPWMIRGNFLMMSHYPSAPRGCNAYRERVRGRRRRHRVKTDPATMIDKNFLE